MSIRVQVEQEIESEKVESSKPLDDRSEYDETPEKPADFAGKSPVGTDNLKLPGEGVDTGDCL